MWGERKKEQTMDEKKALRNLQFLSSQQYKKDI